MKKLLIILLSIIFWCECYSQSIKTVSAEYIYYIPENVSIDDAKSTALYRARIQALADEFGTIVTQTTSTYVSNDNGNTDSQFFSLGGSDVKGEWIEDCNPPEFELLTDGGTVAMRVKVKGRAREIKNTKIAINVKVLRNGTTDADESDHFVSGDGIYMTFNSPASGYLAIYLLDADDNAFCLLPYQGQTTGIFETNANKRYIFFHPDYADGLNRDIVEEIVADTERAQEQNRILVVFSPKKFYKGADSKSGMDLPRSMSVSAFQKWLSDVRKGDPELIVSERQISIFAKQ